MLKWEEEKWTIEASSLERVYIDWTGGNFLAEFLADS